jgi:flagella basal body P-ring formation protein FlgA
MSEKLLRSVEIDDLLLTAKPAEPEPADSGKVGATSPLMPTTLATSDPVQRAAAGQRMLGEAELLSELRNQMVQRLELKDDLRIQLDKSWVGLAIPEGNWELRFVSFPSVGLRNRMWLDFDLVINGNRHSTWQVGLRCELWRNVLIPVQTIERMNPLSNSQFEVRNVDILGLMQAPVDHGIDLADYLAARGLKVGEPLTWKDLKEKPLVSKNSMIEAYASEGGMRIRLKAKALEDGIRGQTIRVRNLQSSRDIQGEVTGVNQVRVYF